MHRSHRLVRLVSILVLGGFALGVCFVALTPGVKTLAASARYSGSVGPQLRALEDPTILYDMNGAAYDRLGNLDRQPASLSEVPKVLRDAIIATEDRTFYSNAGIDVRSTVRALVSNVDAGGVEQGGSTITQQLIKNRYFKNPRRNLDRKIREAVLANRLTNEWSKDRILKEYLNTVYFGENSYGVKAAAERIVGKPLSALGLADAALLAGSIANPTAFNRFDHPDAARRRRDEVVRRMLEQHRITKLESAYVRASGLAESARPTNQLSAQEPYGEEVLSILKTLPELGADLEQRTRSIFSNGLRVYTEFDPRLSTIANAAVNSVIKPSFGPFRAAMAVMDPRTGSVRAIVDGSTGAQGYNLATDGGGRKVGSTFKPITLATAIEKGGYSPRDTVDGSGHCSITYPGWNSVPPYVAENSNESSGGYADLYSQTKNSVNCAYLRLMTSVGPPKVRDMATQLGYTHPIAPNLSMGIGETEHTPLEVATVFSTFADDGIKHAPVFVRRIEDSRGRVLYRSPAGVRVLSTETARTVTDVLSHVTEGTAPRARLGGRPLAGKTGTTDRQTDAWFAGYTPQLVAAVWMGNKDTGNVDNEASWMDNVGEFRPVFGGTYPAIIWQKFMTEALKGLPFIAFVAPDETLWPKAAQVNPAGGRGGAVPDFSNIPDSTSTTVPTASTSTTSVSTASTSTTTSATTSTTKPGP